ncbi:hypothetical protein EW146_g6670 [Bondarzewia mesenterica]|uniref:Hydrophobin n=1 Tax=Bondarzewia mesenterica TaxID=1095465 RepID=A0A4V3XEG3_9AGAM|nr:hypothetical protein EW146_g6670 [Bondarzewia mesenterica]
MFIHFSSLSACSVLAVAILAAARPSWTDLKLKKENAHKGQNTSNADIVTKIATATKLEATPMVNAEVWHPKESSSKEEGTDQCSTGHIQCCRTVEPAESEGAERALSLAGFIVRDAHVPIGLDCSPTNGSFGVGSGATCESQPVCCVKIVAQAAPPAYKDEYAPEDLYEPKEPYAHKDDHAHKDEYAPEDYDHKAKPGSFDAKVDVTKSNSQSENSCNAGNMQCCGTVENANSKDASKALGLLGLVLQDVNVPVGLNCDPINALSGVGAGASCASQPVCCDKTEAGGVGINCMPINAAV